MTPRTTRTVRSARSDLDAWHGQLSRLRQRVRKLAPDHQRRIAPYVRAVRDHFDKIQIDLQRLQRLEAAWREAREALTGSYVNLEDSWVTADRKLEQLKDRPNDARSSEH